MTLVDSRPGIHAALVAYRAASGVPVDADAIVGRLGPPVATELLPLVGPDRLDAELAAFRRHMAEVGVTNARAMPGAAEALTALATIDGRSLVVTAKHRPLAVATLETCGLAPDLVVGDLWADEKAAPLREHGAAAYVGDHTGDIAAARAAGCVAVAVATGHLDATGLAAADHVLSSLAELPALIDAWSAR